MSEETVEIVRASLEAWKAGDIAALLELCHPNVIMMGPGNWANETPTIGRRAVRNFFKVLGGHWNADGEPQVTSLDNAGDRLVARLSGPIGRRPPESLTCVFTVEEGKISLIERYDHHEEALKPVGLKE